MRSENGRLRLKTCNISRRKKKNIFFFRFFFFCFFFFSKSDFLGVLNLSSRPFRCKKKFFPNEFQIRFSFVSRGLGGGGGGTEPKFKAFYMQKKVFSELVPNSC